LFNALRAKLLAFQRIGKELRNFLFYFAISLMLAICCQCDGGKSHWESFTLTAAVAHRSTEHIAVII
jgi:hypothetical protein